MESPRDEIHRHMDAGTCFICKQLVKPEQGLNEATGAHWDCQSNTTKIALARSGWPLVFRQNFKRRRPCGEGRTAKRIRRMAEVALSKVVGYPVTVTLIWMQEGAYRGPKWDLDAWGVHWEYTPPGFTKPIKMLASSLSTMGGYKGFDMEASFNGRHSDWTLDPVPKPNRQTKLRQPKA